MNATNSLPYLIFLIATFAFQSYGAVNPVNAEFSGSATEDWESFSRANVSGLSGVELPIFGGSAAISGQNEYIWLSCEGVANPSLGCFGLGAYAARSHDGNQGYGTSLASGTSRITFKSPVYRFGGFWGSASTTVPIVFQFYDSLGASLEVAACCTRLPIQMAPSNGSA